MHVTPLTWGITIVVLLAFIIFDFYSHVRRPHDPTMREAAAWMLFYIGLACLFGGFLWVRWPGAADPHQHGLEFFAGYITELSLSVDNLFIFALIIGSFRIPKRYQQKVLLIGIALAIVFRGIFIGLGAAIIAAWSDVFYLFAIFLIYIAIKTVYDEVADKPQPPVHDMTVVKLTRTVIPVSDEFDGDRLVTRSGGRRMVTPLMIALVCIGFIDLLFAFDSIPAIYGLTREPYIVFTANIFALMGLRQMYFLLEGLLDRLVYLAYGLGAILGFIAVKLLLHALHENNLPFLNGGEGLAVPEISTPMSLAVIVVVLAVTVAASWLKIRRDENMGAVPPPRLDPGGPMASGAGSHTVPHPDRG